MIDNAVLGLLTFALLIVWSVQLTKLVVRRRRAVRGWVTKFRYSLPAFAAWCWPAVIACEAALPKLPFAVSWTLPFIAPLLGALLAAADCPTVESQKPTVLQIISRDRASRTLTCDSARLPRARCSRIPHMSHAGPELVTGGRVRQGLFRDTGRVSRATNSSSQWIRMTTCRSVRLYR